ncbi:MAG: radical SAM protein [Alphaproteobacteria bacterium]|nr:radical SAM protein [Alphaproteobacteria bacterium]
MSSSCGAAVPRPSLDPAKFRDPDVTANGARRASVRFRGFETLWFNTGTLCNLACRNCYIESSPSNDSLAYLTASEVAGYLDELATLPPGPGTARQIGFTGGEPFMNPDIVAMLEDALGRGHSALVLTNAMRPMERYKAALQRLRTQHGHRLAIRVSLDHYTPALHELERGPGTWPRTLAGLSWLSDEGFHLTVAGRSCWGEGAAQARDGYARLFAAERIRVNAHDQDALVLFPEMDASLDVLEISEQCWDKVDVHPDDVMCAGSRMVIKRKGAAHPVVVPCTLLPYGDAFEMGRTLSGSMQAVKLNHPHCARFCVLGGGSCSGRAG